MAAALAQCSSLLAGRALVRPARAGLRAPCNGTRVVMKVGNWFPGSDTPAYLDKLPASYGFDPLGLGKVPDTLARYQEAELIHARWAMLGVVGALVVELLGYGNWVDAQTWVAKGGSASWAGIPNPLGIGTLLAIQFVLFAFAEAKRNEESNAEKRRYPGGAFDPLGFSKDSKSFEEYKLKELKNGRLAMLAFLGFIAVYSATGQGPLAALGDHLSSPWTKNFATNDVSLPFGHSTV